MRDLRSTKIEGKVYLFPVPVVKERKYLIYCQDQQQADEIAAAVQNKQVTHPDLISEYFLYLALHTDQQTKIYVFNPEMKII